VLLRAGACGTDVSTRNHSSCLLHRPAVDQVLVGGEIKCWLEVRSGAGWR
jgi:hypothetical protein